MTQDDAREVRLSDRDRLAELLWERECRHAASLWDEPADVQQGFREDADAILASDWLAAREADLRESLRKAEGRGDAAARAYDAQRQRAERAEAREADAEQRGMVRGLQEAARKRPCGCAWCCAGVEPAKRGQSHQQTGQPRISGQGEPT